MQTFGILESARACFPVTQDELIFRLGFCESNLPVPKFFQYFIDSTYQNLG